MWSKRVWSACAHFVLVVVIVVQLAFIVFVMVKVVPAYVKSFDDGLIGYDVPPQAESVMAWANSCLLILIRVANNFISYWWLWTLAVVACLGLFEWRVHGESKPLVRLSALGIAAFGSALFMGLMAVALVIPYVVAVPRLFVQEPEPIVRERLAQIDLSLQKLDGAMARRDWIASRDHVLEAWDSVRYLEGMGAAAPAMVSRSRQQKIADVRDKLRSASDLLSEAQQAFSDQDAHRADAAMRKFRQAYAQVAASGAVDSE